MDLARSVQEVTEEIVLKMAEHVRKETNKKYLCLAGGVALNCVANGKLLRTGIFDDIWIQPAAGDAGGALGAALAVWHLHLKNDRKADKNDSMQGCYLGPEFDESFIRDFAKKNNYKYTKLNSNELFDKVADLINDEKVIGWFDGKMEFGPRALGARSIIGDARSSKMQKIMNLKIKYRESFRPFAPSVLAEEISNYFEIDRESPYMLLVANVKKDRQIEMSKEQNDYFGLEKLNLVRSDIPAITHVDYSARIQSVNGKFNPNYHKLISTFNKKFGSGVIVNTSFNVRGEPIVCTPEDAYRCFMRTEMDYLVLGNYIFAKTDQKELTDDSNWREEFQLD
jgi:carbamoyltransferase